MAAPRIIRRLVLAFLAATSMVEGDEPRSIRFATFNVALNRPKADALRVELRTGSSQPAAALAEIIQRVQPDVLLLNEVDYDSQHESVTLFCTKYLAISQHGQPTANYPYRFIAAVNTGVPTGMDLDHDGQVDGPGDAFGFGAFPGQYGMAVLSKYPIVEEDVRTFQSFLWKDMPAARLPRSSRGDDFYTSAILDRLRLSSKSHWDVPIRVASEVVVHCLVSHPTPPVFDGPEDRNGTRNHDEIRFLADYVDPNRSHYIYDDRGIKGGLPQGSRFVIAGDLNADPHDGDSTDWPIRQLLDHRLVNSRTIPQSQGAKQQSENDGGANLQQRGPAENDTGNFPDESVGNLRTDYVLPSHNLKTREAGVFWPMRDEDASELVTASDHRLVWIDVVVE